jgi:hypothetical protein
MQSGCGRQKDSLPGGGYYSDTHFLTDFLHFFCC